MSNFTDDSKNNPLSLLSTDLANFHLQNSTSETIQSLGNTRDDLEQKLQEFVSLNCDELLSQLNKVDQFEDYLTRMKSKVNNLLSVVDGIRSQLNNPYEQIAHRILVLNRLHTTCDLLRRIIRFMHLSRQVNQIDLKTNDPNRGVIRAAQCVSELNDLIAQDDNLLKIEIIKSDLIHLGDKQNDVLEIANSCFNDGLDKQDFNQIGTALQVYWYFNLLQEKVDQFIEHTEKLINEDIKNVFDLQEYSQSKASGPGGAIVMITPTQSAVFREKFWNKLEDKMEKMASHFVRVDLLLKTLKKKRDISESSFLFDLLQNPISLSDFLTKTLDNLNREMVQANSSSNTMKDALEGEYPKLLRIFTNVWTRLVREEKDIDLESMMKSILQPFATAHSARPIRQQWRAMQ
ncbi:conserved oligomeric Golgi complex subunit 5 four way stop [Brevipalpus obovatus]|uniref:conserved oligomeric Golgi complex subunit 5 four way stop n=1 Tax=Brevipalpus obovatus TaxID=246614 RepID=UPI003D9F2C79